jgi:hypothetical protein
MIPTIGLMVAAIGVVVCLYVLTRMSEIFDSEVKGGVRFLCVLTAVAAVLAIPALALLGWGLLITGVDSGSPLSY